MTHISHVHRPRYRFHISYCFRVIEDGIIPKNFWSGTYIVSGPLFVGMSGVVYGLLGYIWMMTRFQVGTRYMLSEQTVMFMLLWLGLCLVGIIPHVANTEHVVGMLLGVAWGFVRSGGGSQMRRR